MFFRIFIIFIFFPIAAVSAQEKNTINIDNTKIDILFPNIPIKGTILVLPGWSFPQDDICQKSNFCSLALAKGYVLVMPDMQKTVYQSAFFPETRADRKETHTIQWITDTLIPEISKQFQLLKKDQNNYILGISTGGRGVALIVEKTGILFKAGAALSGDFDQTLMPNDKLMISFYGSFAEFPQRWKTIDNPRTDAHLIKIPLFLAHGKNDKIVPVEQTMVFFDILNKNKKNAHKMVIVPDAGHDYHFWEMQYENVFDFFSQFK